MASLTPVDDPPPPLSPTPPAHSHFLDAILNPDGLAETFSSSSARSPPAAMAPAHGRLSNGYVDLTSMPDSPPRSRKRHASSPGPSTKRNRPQPTRPDVTATVQAAPPEPYPTPGAATTFNTFTCVICMDNPTDLSATACGHLFCHTCLMEALIAGENRTGPGEAKRSQCPVCRKLLSRTKASDIVPLLLKKGLATQPRKKTVVSAGPTTTEI